MTDAELQRWQLYIRQRVLIDPVTGCWLWQLSTGLNGYGQASTAYDHGLDNRAHRVAYRVFIGPIPEGLQVRHQCHNRPCCNPEHLLLGTHQDNTDDGIRDGRIRGNAGLSVQQVAEIKRLLELRIYTQRQIAAMFTVSQPTINLIARGRTWSDISPATTEGN